MDNSLSISLFLLIWAITGIIAFVLSLICFTKSGGTMAQNIVGLVLAILFGPFYLVYYFLMKKDKGYCTD